MSPLVLFLVAESIALVIALYFIVFRAPPAGPVRTAPSPMTQASPRSAEDDSARQAKELVEARAQLSELREQLKRIKKDRYDSKQAEKGGHDLHRERETVERAASQQLEVTRAELAAALAEVAHLKEALELQRGRSPAPAAPKPVAAPAPAETPASAPIRVREQLNPAELAKIERAEHLAAKDRAKAAELERELKRVRGKGEMHARLYTVVKGELDLTRDKFKALEKRLNRTLLERDLVVRAIRQLERESGKTAERTELTAEEVAGSDARTDAEHQAEAAALQRVADAAAAPPPEEAAEPPPKASA